LSRIKYQSDLEPALEHLVATGYVTNEELPEITEQLKSLLNHPDVKSWFDEGWEVRTEVPILVPGGEESRIDRLMTKDTKAVVVDFKTGKAIKEDQKQVISYMDILRDMNYTDIEGYILYLRDSEVVEVKSGKPKKVSKRKDEDQLDLFG
jgi:RecB family exonuclease